MVELAQSIGLYLRAKIKPVFPESNNNLIHFSLGFALREK